MLVASRHFFIGGSAPYGNCCMTHNSAIGPPVSATGYRAATACAHVVEKYSQLAKLSIHPHIRMSGWTQLQLRLNWDDTLTNTDPNKPRTSENPCENLLPHAHPSTLWPQKVSFSYIVASKSFIFLHPSRRASTSRKENRAAAHAFHP